MSSRDPLWFCHQVCLLSSHGQSHSHSPQCHAEMSPLMVSPSPPLHPRIHVFLDARSHLRFLSRLLRGKGTQRSPPYLSILTPLQLENPVDDPRDFQNRGPNAFDIPNDIPGAFQGLLRSGSVSLAPLIPRPNSLPLGSWNTSEDFASPPRTRSPPTQRAHDHSSVCTPFYPPHPCFSPTLIGEHRPSLRIPQWSRRRKLQNLHPWRLQSPRSLTTPARSSRAYHVRVRPLSTPFGSHLT